MVLKNIANHFHCRITIIIGIRQYYTVTLVQVQGTGFPALCIIAPISSYFAHLLGVTVHTLKRKKS